MDQWLVDGRWQAAVPVADRGLQYGDGLFETIGCSGGAPLLWPLHLARLLEGCRRLGFPEPDAEVLEHDVREALGEADSAVVKLILTRGDGGRGYRPPRPAQPRRLLSCRPLPQHPLSHWRDGIRARYCRTRLGWQPALAGLKQLNRLEQVLARAEWDDPAIVEGLMLDQNGRVIEGTMSNLFVLDRGVLRTPPLRCGGVAGVMREELLRRAPGLGLQVQETELQPADLEAAEGICVSNSLIGIWPVRELAGQRYRPAPGVRALLQDLSSSDCFPYAREVAGALA